MSGAVDVDVSASVSIVEAGGDQPTGSNIFLAVGIGLKGIIETIFHVVVFVQKSLEELLAMSSRLVNKLWVSRWESQEEKQVEEKEKEEK